VIFSDQNIFLIESAEYHLGWIWSQAWRHNCTGKCKWTAKQNFCAPFMPATLFKLYQPPLKIQRALPVTYFNPINYVLQGICTGKGFPYSIPSIGPGADPGVQAVSLQVSHPPGGRLPLLSATPAVTSPAAEHHRPLAGTKLYCLVTEAHRCKQLA